MSWWINSRIVKRVVYTSRASKAMDDNDLVVLLVQSRSNNERDGVTGMLLYAEGAFLQCIEGPEYSIADLMGRLELDPRHTDFNVIQETRCDERRFDDWTMGFRAVTAADIAGVLQRADIALPEGADVDGSALALLERLAREPG